MKKTLSIIISAMLCRAMCSCTLRLPEPAPQDPLPRIPAELYAVNEIAPECMEELQERVAALTITDFLHPDRIARIENRGFALAAENISVIDCNEISFELVLTKADGTSLRLPACGVLMYQYQPMNETYINGLHILWGNLEVSDNQIVFANIDTLSVWSADTLQKIFRQPDMSFADSQEFLFIIDAVKTANGYTVAYYCSDGSGFAQLSAGGQFVGQPMQYYGKDYTLFGTQKVSQSMMFNTKFRASTLMHSFYVDEAEKQLFMYRKFINGYSGPDFEMYDFEKGGFTSSHLMASYRQNPCDFEVYGMTSYADGYDKSKDTAFIAVKKEKDVVVDMVAFTADVDPTEFGMDKVTGWNTNMNISLSSDMNRLTMGCRKTNTVMDIDFSTRTADVYKSATMPQMLGVANSPNSQHVLYRGWAESPTPLVVRILSGDCRMDWLTNVSGRWGVDWLADFSTHKYIYVLTKNEFMIFSWEGTNNWEKVVRVTGNYDVNEKTVQRMCNIYM